MRKSEVDMANPETKRNTLEPAEPHPMAFSAKEWIIKNFNIQELTMHLEALSSCAIEGNRLGEICGETLHRLMLGEPVSDRYLLGLAWYLRNAKEKEGK